MSDKFPTFGSDNDDDDLNFDNHKHSNRLDSDFNDDLDIPTMSGHHTSRKKRNLNQSVKQRPQLAILNNPFGNMIKFVFELLLPYICFILILMILSIFSASNVSNISSSLSLSVIPILSNGISIIVLVLILIFMLFFSFVYQLARMGILWLIHLIVFQNAMSFDESISAYDQSIMRASKYIWGADIFVGIEIFGAILVVLLSGNGYDRSIFLTMIISIFFVTLGRIAAGLSYFIAGIFLFIDQIDAVSGNENANGFQRFLIVLIYLSPYIILILIILYMVYQIFSGIQPTFLF